MELINHLEQYLGKIENGWNNFSTMENWQIQVAEMHNDTYSDVAFFSTTGLSNFSLLYKEKGIKFHQELFISIPKYFGIKNIPSVLYDIANYGIANNKAFLRGSVFDFYKGHVFEGKYFTSFYLAPPIIFPDSFATKYFADINKTVVFCWLIPIYENEREYININGWEAFENLIEKTDPNFFDLDRKTIV